MAAPTPTGVGVGHETRVPKPENLQMPKKEDERRNPAVELIDLTLSSDEDEPVAGPSKHRLDPLPAPRALLPRQAGATAAFSSNATILPFTARASSPVRRSPAQVPPAESPPPPPSAPSSGGDKGKKRARSRSPEVLANKRIAHPPSSTSSAASSARKDVVVPPSTAQPAASGSTSHPAAVAEKAKPSRPSPAAALPPSSSSTTRTPTLAPRVRTSPSSTLPDREAPGSKALVTVAPPASSSAANPPSLASISTLPALARPPVASSSSPLVVRPAAAPTAPRKANAPPSSSSLHAAPLPVAGPSQAPLLPASRLKNAKGTSPDQRTLLVHPRNPAQSIRCRPPPPPLPAPSPGSLSYLAARFPRTGLVKAGSHFPYAKAPEPPPDDPWEAELDDRWEFLSIDDPEPHTQASDCTTEDHKLTGWRRGCAPEDWDLEDEAPELKDRRFAPWEELPFTFRPLESVLPDVFDPTNMRRVDKIKAAKAAARAEARGQAEGKGKGKGKEVRMGFVETRVYATGSGDAALFESLKRLEDPDAPSDPEDATDSEEERANPTPWFSSLAMPVARTERKRQKAKKAKKERRARGERSATATSASASGSPSPSDVEMKDS
ncbi:hypothetical protein JCM6882_003775 [Rhodosporidiobolus microsporus]